MSDKLDGFKPLRGSLFVKDGKHKHVECDLSVALRAALALSNIDIVQDWVDVGGELRVLERRVYRLKRGVMTRRVIRIKDGFDVILFYAATPFKDGMVCSVLDVTNCLDALFFPDSGGVENKKLIVPGLSSSFTFQQWRLLAGVILALRPQQTQQKMGIKKGTYDAYMRELKAKLGAVSKQDLIYKLYKADFVVCSLQRGSWR